MTTALRDGRTSLETRGTGQGRRSGQEGFLCPWRAVVSRLMGCPPHHTPCPNSPCSLEGATYLRTVDVKVAVDLVQGDCPHTLFHQLKRGGSRSNWNPVP